MANDCDAVLIGVCRCHGGCLIGAVGEMASVKRPKLWKTGEDGLCCSSSAIQTWLGPSSLLEERSGVPMFLLFFCVVGYPPNWAKWPRYIDRYLIVLIFCAFLLISNFHGIFVYISSAFEFFNFFFFFF